MNQLNIDVNPRHSGVFMSVFEGVKKKNIQKIIDGLVRMLWIESARRRWKGEGLSVDA